MKLYLASFLEPGNFGPSGRIVGISFNSPPPKAKEETQVSLESVGLFEPFAPSKELIHNYQEQKFDGIKEAGNNFSVAYEQQLEDYCQELEQEAIKENCSMLELLPFEDGDTLCSWERNDRTHYRGTLAKYLKRLGYEVSDK